MHINRSLHVFKLLIYKCTDDAERIKLAFFICKKTSHKLKQKKKKKLAAGVWDYSASAAAVDAQSDARGGIALAPATSRAGNGPWS